MTSLLSLQDLQKVVQIYSNLSIGSLRDFTSVGEADGLGLNASKRFFCGGEPSPADPTKSSPFQGLWERILFGDTFQQGVHVYLLACVINNHTQF